MDWRGALASAVTWISLRPRGWLAEVPLRALNCNNRAVTGGLMGKTSGVIESWLLTSLSVPEASKRGLTIWVVVVITFAGAVGLVPVARALIASEARGLNQMARSSTSPANQAKPAPEPVPMLHREPPV